MTSSPTARPVSRTLNDVTLHAAITRSFYSICPSILLLIGHRKCTFVWHVTSPIITPRPVLLCRQVYIKMSCCGFSNRPDLLARCSEDGSATVEHARRAAVVRPVLRAQCCRLRVPHRHDDHSQLSNLQERESSNIQNGRRTSFPVSISTLQHNSSVSLIVNDAKARCDGLFARTNRIHNVESELDGCITNLPACCRHVRFGCLFFSL